MANNELKNRAREIITQLDALYNAKRPGGGVHGQVIGMEPWVIRTTGDGLQCVYDAQSLLDELLDPFDRRTAPAQAEPSVALPDAAMVDKHLDAVLRASGSGLQHYTMYKTLEAMRAAMRAYAKQAIESRILGQQGGVSDAARLEDARREGWGQGMQEAQELLAGEIADAARYQFLRHADLDALAAKYWGNGEVYEGAQLDIVIDEQIAAIQAQAGDAPMGGK